MNALIHSLNGNIHTLKSLVDKYKYLGRVYRILALIDYYPNLKFNIMALDNNNAVSSLPNHIQEFIKYELIGGNIDKDFYRKIESLGEDLAKNKSKVENILLRLNGEKPATVVLPSAHNTSVVVRYQYVPSDVINKDKIILPDLKLLDDTVTRLNDTNMLAIRKLRLELKRRVKNIVELKDINNDLMMQVQEEMDRYDICVNYIDDLGNVINKLRQKLKNTAVDNSKQETATSVDQKTEVETEDVNLFDQIISNTGANIVSWSAYNNLKIRKDIEINELKKQLQFYTQFSESKEHLPIVADIQEISDQEKIERYEFCAKYIKDLGYVIKDLRLKLKNTAVDDSIERHATAVDKETEVETEDTNLFDKIISDTRANIVSRNAYDNLKTRKDMEIDELKKQLQFQTQLNESEKNLPKVADTQEFEELLNHKLLLETDYQLEKENNLKLQKELKENKRIIETLNSDIKKVNSENRSLVSLNKTIEKSLIESNEMVKRDLIQMKEDKKTIQEFKMKYKVDIKTTEEVTKQLNDDIEKERDQIRKEKMAKTEEKKVQSQPMQNVTPSIAPSLAVRKINAPEITLDQLKTIIKATYKTKIVLMGDKTREDIRLYMTSKVRDIENHALLKKLLSIVGWDGASPGIILIDNQDKAHALYIR